MGSHERRAISEAVYGMLRQARRLEFALEPVAHRLTSQPIQDLATYIAWQLLEGGWHADQAFSLMPDVPWEEVVRCGQREQAIHDRTRRLGIMRSLPDWLAAELLAEYGEEADALAAALNRRAPLTIRANTLRITREALAARLAEEGVETTPCAVASAGLRFKSFINAFGLKSFQEGLFEVQDEASQLVTELVAPPPHSVVVDACAGAGGKTLALAALMHNQGRLWALDPSPRKLEELVRRCRRNGATSVRSLRIAQDSYPPEVMQLQGKVKRVLTDVPCSGLGAMRRNPETRWRLTTDDLVRLPEVQESIAARALPLLLPGGRLIYSTCTILPKENERVVERLLARFPRLELVRPAEILGGARAANVVDSSGWFFRPLPHRTEMDGFFAAVMRLRGE